MSIYTINQVSENGYHLIDENGKALNGWDGQPQVMNKEVAELALYNVNNPLYKFPQPLKKSSSKVMDNRHRNWRRRS